MRKTFTGGGAALSGISLWLSSLGGHVTCVLFFIVGLAFFGVQGSNLYAITQRLAGPHAAGRWTGFQNGFGNLAGVVVPVVTGFVLSRTGNFSWVFAIMALVTLIGAASWFFLVGPVEPVTWTTKQSSALEPAAL